MGVGSAQRGPRGCRQIVATVAADLAFLAAMLAVAHLEAPGTGARLVGICVRRDGPARDAAVGLRLGGLLLYVAVAGVVVAVPLLSAVPSGCSVRHVSPSRTDRHERSRSGREGPRGVPGAVVLAPITGGAASTAGSSTAASAIGTGRRARRCWSGLRRLFGAVHVVDAPRGATCRVPPDADGASRGRPRVDATSGARTSVARHRCAHGLQRHRRQYAIFQRGVSGPVS